MGKTSTVWKRARQAGGLISPSGRKAVRGASQESEDMGQAVEMFLGEQELEIDQQKGVGPGVRPTPRLGESAKFLEQVV